LHLSKLLATIGFNTGSLNETARQCSRREADGVRDYGLIGRLAVIALGTVAASALLATGSANAAPTFDRYVALGDSYASVGSLLSLHGPVGCARSTANYAAGVAAILNVGELADATCSNAKIEHLTGPQTVPLGTNPAQFDSLDEKTGLVTITMGGNDIGFESTITRCGLLSVSDPAGNPCERDLTAGGTDRLQQRIDELAPRFSQALQAIRRLAPKAEIVVVGYLPMLPAQNGCWPAVPIAQGDVTYLHTMARKLNGMFARQATAHGAISVDPSDDAGHDMCQAPKVRWVEPTVPASATTPFHPNAEGQRHLAAVIAAAVG
jgi:lysophospholipase L1-like esterase